MRWSCTSGNQEAPEMRGMKEPPKAFLWTATGAEPLPYFYISIYLYFFSLSFLPEFGQFYERATILEGEPSWKHSIHSCHSNIHVSATVTQKSDGCHIHFLSYPAIPTPENGGPLDLES